MTKDDQDKPRFTLVPQKALLVVARIMTGGAKRYGDYNWKQDSGDGKDVARLLDAAGRHFNSHNMGEKMDESGHPHLGHAICSLMMALEREMDAERSIEDDVEDDVVPLPLANGKRPQGRPDVIVKNMEYSAAGWRPHISCPPLVER